MSIFYNNYFFDYFFPNFRGNSKINDYFNTEYNQAILSLSKEGYDFLEEFQRLVQIYERNYNLNQSELLFLMNINYSYISNHDKYILILPKIEKYKNIIRFSNSFIFTYKEFISNLSLKCNIKYLQTECRLLEFDIEEMKPIYEAVVLRICTKKLLEIFIKKNIQLIELNNYSPSKDDLNIYLKSLQSNLYSIKI